MATGWCRKIVPLFEFPALAAAWQTDQPMHSQSAKTEHLQTYFTQLAEVLFMLNPVEVERETDCVCECVRRLESVRRFKLSNTGGLS